VRLIGGGDIRVLWELIMRIVYGTIALFLVSTVHSAADTVRYIYGDITGPNMGASYVPQFVGPLPGPNPYDGYFVSALYLYFSDADGNNMTNVAVADVSASNGPSGPTYAMHGAFALITDTSRYLHTGSYFAHGAGEYPNVNVFLTLTLSDGLSFSPIETSIPEPSTWAMLLIGFAGIGFAAYYGRPEQAWVDRLI
jgi:hypothetical protein